MTTPPDEPKEALVLSDLWFRKPESTTAICTPAQFRNWILGRGNACFIALGHIWRIKSRRYALGVIELYAERKNP